MSSVEIHICGYLEPDKDHSREIYVVNHDTEVFSSFHEELYETYCGLKDIITLINTFGIHHTDYHHPYEYAVKYKNQLESDGYIEINIE